MSLPLTKNCLNFSIEAFGTLKAWGAASHCRYLKYLALTY